MGQGTLDGLMVYPGKGRFKIVWKNLSPELITFKGKFNHPVHSWFRLTPSYSPDLVNILLNELGKSSSQDVVLDPFSGTGTTLLECKKRGIPSIGVEINPVLYRVTRASSSWDRLDPGLLKNIVRAFLDFAEEMFQRFGSVPLSKFETHGIMLPRLSNLFRWWAPDVLRDLLLIREAFKEYAMELPEEYQDFLWIGMASILLDFANIRRNHPTISFVDNPFNLGQSNGGKNWIKKFSMSVLAKKYEVMIKDVEKVKTEVPNPAPSMAMMGDSKHLGDVIPGEYHGRITRVITSPPYPNRYSYVMETRPYLYFFEVFTSPSQASELDMETIGGTWGKATFSLKGKRIRPVNSIVDDALSDIPEKIYPLSDIMANYVVKYFNDMYLHLAGMSRILKEGDSRIAYVIGNSYIKGVEVPSDLLLARILEGLGFTVEKIWHLRKRGGKRGLYEAVVFARY